MTFESYCIFTVFIHLKNSVFKVILIPNNFIVSHRRFICKFLRHFILLTKHTGCFKIMYNDTLQSGSSSSRASINLCIKLCQCRSFKIATDAWFWKFYIASRLKNRFPWTFAIYFDTNIYQVFCYVPVWGLLMILSEFMMTEIFQKAACQHFE